MIDKQSVLKPNVHVRQQLKRRAKLWLILRQKWQKKQARYALWFGETSLMMWLLALMCSYFLLAILVMFYGQRFDLLFDGLVVWFGGVFLVWTLVVGILYWQKNNLKDFFYHRLTQLELRIEENFSEMYVLARDSILPEIHAMPSMSLSKLYHYYQGEMSLISFYAILQEEVALHRMGVRYLGQNDYEMLSSFDDVFYQDLLKHSDEIVYFSLLD